MKSPKQIIVGRLLQAKADPSVDIEQLAEQVIIDLAYEGYVFMAVGGN